MKCRKDLENVATNVASPRHSSVASPLVGDEKATRPPVNQTQHEAMNVGQVATCRIQTLIAILALTISIHPAIAQSPNPHTLVKQANQLYKTQDYQSALNSYNQANLAKPDSPEIAYNRALAHYKLNQLTQANNLLNQALSTRDKSLEAKIKYNLGNVAYAQALENQENPKQAINHLKTAITRYRDARDINPTDEDALANINSAQSLIKRLIQQQNQEQQQDQNKDQEQDQKDEQEQEQSKDGDQEKQDQKQQDQQQENQDQQKDQEGKKQEQSDQQNQQSSEEQDQPPQQAEPREVKMTPEQAERLLQAVRDKERNRQDEKTRLRRVGRRPVLKDW